MNQSGAAEGRAPTVPAPMTSVGALDRGWVSSKLSSAASCAGVPTTTTMLSPVIGVSGKAGRIRPRCKTPTMFSPTRAKFPWLGRAEADPGLGLVSARYIGKSKTHFSCPGSLQRTRFSVNEAQQSPDSRVHGSTAVSSRDRCMSAAPWRSYRFFCGAQSSIRLRNGGPLSQWDGVGDNRPDQRIRWPLRSRSGSTPKLLFMEAAHVKRLGFPNRSCPRRAKWWRRRALGRVGGSLPGDSSGPTSSINLPPNAGSPKL